MKMCLRRLRIKFLARRCRSRLLRGGTLKLENGLSVSLSPADVPKFAFLLTACNKKYKRVEKKTLIMSHAKTDMRLYTRLFSVSLWPHDYFVATFNLPSIPVHALFSSSHLNDLIEKLASMNVEAALEECDVFIFNEAMMSNKAAGFPLVARAIKNNLDLPLAFLVYG